jgi:hypothetical protein
VIATTTYDDPLLRQLRAPATDALGLAAVLADPTIGGFEVTSVVDRPAQELRVAIDEFLAGRLPEDLVVVYFSCHGVTDARRRLHFAATDTFKSRLAATGVDSVWVNDRMEECRARRQVLILDCCFSGAFARGAKGDEALGLDHLTEPGRGRAVLTASNATEYSFETPTSGQPTPDAPAPGSIFTAALLAGLRDGSADRDGDGFVTVDEAYAYAYQRVRESAAAQTPQRWLSGGEGQLLLARNPTGRTVIAAVPPESLRAALDSPWPNVRIGAVDELSDWLTSADPGRVLTAIRELEAVADNDIPRVAAAARSALGHGPADAEHNHHATIAPTAQTPRLVEQTDEEVRQETEEQARLDQVLVVAYPDPDERDHATYWLGWLAHHMNTQPSGPTRDLCWWQIPGWVDRWQVGLVGGVVGGLVGGLMVWLIAWLMLGQWLLIGYELGLTFGLVPGLMSGLTFGLVFGLVSGLMVGLKVKAVAPRQMTIRWPTRQGLTSGVWLGGLMVGLVFGLVGLMLGLVFTQFGGGTPGAPRAGTGEYHRKKLAQEVLDYILRDLPFAVPIAAPIAVPIVFGLVGALVGGLAFWLTDAWQVPLAAILNVTPRLIYQRDLRSQLVAGPMVGLIGGLGYGLLFGLLCGLQFGLGYGLIFGLVSGLLFGLLLGLVGWLRSAATGGAALSLLFTEIALRLKGRRLRFMPLLETALTRQVLRQAGAVYQFRHPDLQDRLADRYEAQLTRHRTA